MGQPPAHAAPRRMRDLQSPSGTRESNPVFPIPEIGGLPSASYHMCPIVSSPSVQGKGVGDGTRTRIAQLMRLSCYRLHYPAVGPLGFEPRSHGLRVRGFTIETMNPLVWSRGHDPVVKSPLRAPMMGPYSVVPLHLEPDAGFEPTTRSFVDCRSIQAELIGYVRSTTPFA